MYVYYKKFNYLKYNSGYSTLYHLSNHLITSVICTHMYISIEHCTFLHI